MACVCGGSRHFHDDFCSSSCVLYLGSESKSFVRLLYPGIDLPSSASSFKDSFFFFFNFFIGESSFKDSFFSKPVFLTPLSALLINSNRLVLLLLRLRNFSRIIPSALLFASLRAPHNFSNLSSLLHLLPISPWLSSQTKIDRVPNSHFFMRDILFCMSCAAFCNFFFFSFDNFVLTFSNFLYCSAFKSHRLATLSVQLHNLVAA